LVKFNPQKTEFVIFSNKKNIDQVNILFNGENIKQVEYHTHLGNCLSSNCIWCYHINNTCQRATKRIHILRKLKYLLSRSHLSKIYKTMSMIFYLFNILTIKKNVYLVYIFFITKDDKFCLLWIKFYQPCLSPCI
jgi:hypothetical protein